MLTFAEQGAVVTLAVNEMRKEGVPVTPKKVEQVVNAVEQANNARAPFEGREVVGLFAGVTREGKNAGVVKHVRVGAKPAQQYAEPRDYFAEPRLSAAKKAEVEARLRGLETEMQSPGLTPVQVIRLEQEAEQLRRILGKANEQGATRTFAR